MEPYEIPSSPIELTVHLIFGEGNDISGWVNQYPFMAIPGDGSFVNVSFKDINDEIETSATICAEVLYTHIHESNLFNNENSDNNEEDNSDFIVIYGGKENPDFDLIFRLEDAGWTRLEDSETIDIFEMCLHLPLLAGIHNVLFLVGEPGTRNFQAWSQSLIPLDTEVPPFGRRIMFDPIDASTGIEPKIDVDSEGRYDERDINPSLKGSLEKGLPSVVIHSEIVEPGIADIVFWVSSLADIGGLDLMAAGWAQIRVPEDFDPEIFESTERIQLALATKLIWTLTEANGIDEDGEPYLSLVSYEIENPAIVSPKLYHLLPDSLVEYCTVQRSLSELKES